eukprot:scaffold1769_cov132-Skeletonema_dohrnii-CCMP3373.AAC.32
MLLTYSNSINLAQIRVSRVKVLSNGLHPAPLEEDENLAVQCWLKTLSELFQYYHVDAIDAIIIMRCNYDTRLLLLILRFLT